MFVAMNRFKVKPDATTAFEEIWKSRDSRLHEMKGFREFHLLRGPEREAEGYVLYASHTIWESREDFEAWTKSQNFRDAHKNAGSQGRDIYVGHPEFEGFSVVEGA
ncbi:antibiotic biosynthesis monooxygenase family protein [Pelagibacterium montanilacus]|uniref:antibiotic biosynthesis monooxygenase family protein n=1 Tax=Pelagibacterium montanilacus TaxID=2185280 RepID=UPI000F8E4B85|nr:antibiotic biosynthesis monooxygenase [Pelagibacterium montanilacus]